MSDYQTNNEYLKTIAGDESTDYHCNNYYLKQIAENGGSGGGTDNYTSLSNKPKINGVVLNGDKSGADLGLANNSDVAEIQSNLDNLNTIGTVKNGTLYSPMASTQAWQKVAEITLPKGRWLIIGSCQYTSLAQAGLSLSRTINRTIYCVDAQADLLQISGVFTLSGEETLYMIAHHNDTTNQTHPQDLIAIKITN